MNTFLIRSHIGRPKSTLLVFVYLLLVMGLIFVQSANGKTALAASATSHNSGQHFSLQARIGFHSGDDWEPATAADRFGHVYALYKHYDVPGGQTCKGCNLHLLVQRSSDEGRTWTAPRPIAPIFVQGGQYDSLLRFLI